MFDPLMGAEDLAAFSLKPSLSSSFQNKSWICSRSHAAFHPSQLLNANNRLSLSPPPSLLHLLLHAQPFPFISINAKEEDVSVVHAQ